MAKQTINGKAFEYALLLEFFERLKIVTQVSITENEPYKTAKKCFDSFKESQQETFRILNHDYQMELMKLMFYCWKLLATKLGKLAMFGMF